MLTVHDSIVFDCLMSEALQVAEIAKDIMENLPTKTKKILPNISWDWLKVPLVADFEIGYNWGQLVEFNPLELDDNNVSDIALFKDTDDGVYPNRSPITAGEVCDLLDWKMEQE